MKIETPNLTEQFFRVVNQINQKNPFYTLIGLMVIIFLVAYFGAIQFQLATLRSMNPKIGTLAEEIKTAKNNIQRLPQFQMEITKLSEKLNKLKDKIKNKDQVPEILENISRVAGSNNVRIDQLIPNTSVGDPILKNNDGKYYAVPIVVEGLGSYHEVGRFINELETEQMFLQISNFSMGADETDPMRHRIKLTINAIVFEKAGAQS